MGKEERKRLEQYCYDGSRHFSIREASTKETSLCSDKAEALAQMEKNNAKMDELQAKLYAAKKEGVIFLFQAMDAAGKDGTIRSVRPVSRLTAFMRLPSRHRHRMSWRTIFSGEL